MTRKSLITTLSLLIGLILTNGIKNNYVNIIQNVDKKNVVEIVDNADNNDVQNATESENTIITMSVIAAFLEKKNEHYPQSDEFIERYQQTSGGYIDYAKKCSITVDKEMHEPNQKWHFFDSWLNQSIEEGTLTWDADAKKRVYTGLLCPELLLWIYEASDVDPVKVKNAKNVAVQGKVAGTNVSTIAKNMRACVPWEDIEASILSDINENA